MKASSHFHNKKYFQRKSLETVQARFVTLSKLEELSMSRFIYILPLFSYAQIFFQTIQIMRKNFPNSPEQSLFCYQTLEDFFTFENLFNYSQSNSMLLLTCFCIVLYFIIMINGFFLVLSASFKSKEIHPFIKKSWSLLLQFHGPVLFFPINNLCNRLLEEFLNDNLEIFSFKGGNEIIFYSATIVCLINVAFAFFPYIFLFDILPSKSLLSSKTSLVDTVTLVQKFVLSFSRIFLLNIDILAWIIVFFQLTFSLVRHIEFLYVLPRYHFQTLLLDFHLITICSLSSVLSFLIFILNKCLDDSVTFPTSLIIVLLIIPLIIVYTQRSFNKVIKDIIFKPYENLNHYKAIHKVIIIKFLEESMKNPTRRTKQIDNYFFYFSIFQSRLDILSGNKHNESLVGVNLNLKEDQTQIKRRYLEALALHFNKCDEVKLMLARFYTKKASLHGLAMKTLAKIRSHSFSIRIAAQLIKWQMQEMFYKQTRSDHSKENKEEVGVDLNEYFTGLTQRESFKELLKKQFDYQSSFWKEFSKNNPDLLGLQRLSELIYAQKKIISRKWTQVENQGNQAINVFYSIYGCYEILLNDSIAKGRLYFRKFNIFDTKFVPPEKEMNNSILWDKNNVSITIRTHQESMGVILDCSNSIKRVLGYEKEEIIGSNINSMMTRFIGERHNSFIQGYVETGHSVFLGKTQSVFVKSKSGALQKISLWVNIHPLVQHEILLTGIFRVVYDPNEYIFITPEGEIDSSTEKIASKLGISGKKMHIATLCRNFTTIFNVQNVQINQNISTENFRITSEDTLQQSARKLYTREKSFKYPSSPTKHSSNPLPGLFKLKEDKIACKLNFNAYKTGNKLQSYTCEYQCEARNFNMKEDFMTIIEIKISQEKKKHKGTRGFLSKTPQHKVEDKPKELKIKLDDDIGEYDTGTPELLSPATGLLFGDRLENSFSVIENTHNGELSPLPAGNTQQLEENSRVRPGSMKMLFTIIKQKMMARNKLVKKVKKNEQKAEIKNFQNVVEHSVAGSSTSLGDEKLGRVEEIFEEKYYPSTVKLFLVMLIALFLASVFSELYFQIRLDNDLHSSKALAATTSLATTRADALSQIARSGRSSISAQLGFAGSDLSLYKALVNLFMDLTKTYIPILRDTNAALQFAIVDIDEVFQEKFKAIDVRIYDINPNNTIGSYQEFSTFSALSVLIEKALQAKSNFQKTGNFSLQDLNYILVNSVNDVLDKTLATIDIVAENTNLSFLRIIKAIQVSNILILCLLSTAIIITCGFIFHIYITELNSLQIFLGLNPHDVQTIRERLDCFERIIYSDDSGDLNELELNPRAAIQAKDANLNDKRQNAKPKKSVKKRGLQRFYLKKIIIFVFILIAYMIAIYFTFDEMSNKIETLRKKIIGLTKTQSVLYQTSMLTFSIGKVLAGDKLGNVRNKSPEEAFLSDLNAFWKISYELLDTFREKDGSYDPLVAPLFFEDSCQYIVSATPKSQCMNIVKEAKTFGLLSLFSRHHTVYTIMYQDFKAVNNPNFTTYASFILRLLANGSPSTAVIREVILVMIQRIKDHLQELWMNADTYIHITLTLDPICLIIIALVTWKYLLEHFIETWNRFKKMMRFVPLSILLKNPILKGILMKSSKGKLEKLKIDI